LYICKHLLHLQHKQQQKEFLTLINTKMKKLNITPLRKAETQKDIDATLEFWGVIFLALIFATLLS
jgi:hypothetical protein